MLNGVNSFNRSKLMLVFRLTTASLCVLLHSTCDGQTQWKPEFLHHFNRTTFVKKMSRLIDSQRNMSKKQVLSLLGAPDVAKNGEWDYGVAAISRFPTLGKVVFDESGIVTDVIGAKGIPQTQHRISEAKLRHIIDVFASIHTSDSSDFDPLPYIKATNILIREKRQDIFTAASEYCRVSEDVPRGLLYLLTILFDPPTEYPFSRSELSNWTIPPYPQDRKRVPRFPVTLIGDVPLLIIKDESTEGLGSGFVRGQTFIRYIKEHGQMRTRPLTPTLKPLDLLDKVVASNHWLFGKRYSTDHGVRDPQPDEEIYGKQIVMHQLLRLVRSVLPQVSPYCKQAPDPIPNINLNQWQRFQVNLSSRTIGWDAIASEYRVH